MAARCSYRTLMMLVGLLLVSTGLALANEHVVSSPSGESSSDRLKAERLAVERLFWQTVMDSKDPTDIQAYLEKYPAGEFEALARNLLKRLDGSPEQVITKEQGHGDVQQVEGRSAEIESDKRFRDCDTCPEMVVVPAGSFLMGSVPETEHNDNETPQHQVTIKQPIAVSVYQVTRGEFTHFAQATDYSTSDSCLIWSGTKWQEYVGRSWQNPGFKQTDRDPVICVSWNDAQAYVRWLSDRTGERYRLLSESEWEYAARAGTRTARYWGESESDQCRYANGVGRNVSCDDGYAWTAPVGSFRANAFGLHDVLGNVWEWTQDCYNRSYRGAPSDGGWDSGECGKRVVRGGSWRDAARNIRAAVRNGIIIISEISESRRDNIGFRIIRMLR